MKEGLIKLYNDWTGQGGDTNVLTEKLLAELEKKITESGPVVNLDDDAGWQTIRGKLESEIDIWEKEIKQFRLHTYKHEKEIQSRSDLIYVTERLLEIVDQFVSAFHQQVVDQEDINSRRQTP